MAFIGAPGFLCAVLVALDDTEVSLEAPGPLSRIGGIADFCFGCLRGLKDSKSSPDSGVCREDVFEKVGTRSESELVESATSVRADGMTGGISGPIAACCFAARRSA